MRWIYSLVKYGMIGVIILVLGTQFLSSTYWIVYAFRFGNPIPPRILL